MDSTFIFDGERQVGSAVGMFRYPGVGSIPQDLPVGIRAGTTEGEAGHGKRWRTISIVTEFLWDRN